MRVLFYSDAAVFGGHEVTVLDALAGADSVSGITVGITYYKGNRIFHDRLSAMIATRQKIDIEPHSFYSEAGDIIRAFTPSTKRRAILKHLQQWSPDWIIICQGHIGVSICALASATRSGAGVVSFLPNAYTMKQMKGKGGIISSIIDFLLARAYGWPNLFLTIGNSVKDQLNHEHGISHDRIQVVEYGPKIECLQSIPRSKARSYFGLTPGYWMGVVGRIDFGKGYDIVLKAMSYPSDCLKDACLLIVGEGPDLNHAHSLVAEFGLEAKVKFLPWTELPSLVYSALDLLLLPSRYEGVPIVMMEAMYMGLPVVASDIDGIRDILPAEWQFSCGSPSSLLDAICRVRSEDNDNLLNRNRTYITNKRNSELFQRNIGKWIARFCDMQMLVH